MAVTEQEAAPCDQCMQSINFSGKAKISLDHYPSEGTENR